MKILILPGDGIGPEIMAATVTALDALNESCGLKLDFEERTVGMAALEAEGSTLSDDLMGHIKAAEGVILGPARHLCLSTTGGRRHQSVGDDPQGTGPLRQYPPVAGAPWRSGFGAGHGSCDRQGKH